MIVLHLSWFSVLVDSKENRCKSNQFAALNRSCVKINNNIDYLVLVLQNKLPASFQKFCHLFVSDKIGEAYLLHYIKKNQPFIVIVTGQNIFDQALFYSVSYEKQFDLMCKSNIISLQIYRKSVYFQDLT